MTDLPMPTRLTSVNATHKDATSTAATDLNPMTLLSWVTACAARNHHAYLLFDGAQAEGSHLTLQKMNVPYASLFDGTREEALLEIAPLLIALTGLDLTRRQRLLAWALQLDCSASAMSWYESPLQLNTLATRLAPPNRRRIGPSDNYAKNAFTTSRGGFCQLADMSWELSCSSNNPMQAQDSSKFHHLKKKEKNTMKIALARVVTLVALTATFLLACTDGQGGQKAPVVASDKPVMLGIIGFNYTNRYISQFFVDSTGGGNIRVSSPTSGGGGTTCCAGYRPGTRMPIQIHVRWTAGGCTYITREESYNPYIKPRDVEEVLYFYKEADVLVNGPIPPDPSNMEIHFYPDGHVEAAITAEYSYPRLKLDKSREINGYPACTPEQTPGWTKKQ